VSVAFVLSARSLSQVPVETPDLLVTSLPIRIGRNPANGFQLDHWWVSPFHARIVRVKGKLCVLDLGSKEGVHIPLPGGTVRRLRPYEPTELSETGFQFLLGPIRLQLEVIGSESREPE
jgi:pSer/pThr/pTyr-binding forkhead associated (FHA) protein